MQMSEGCVWVGRIQAQILLEGHKSLSFSLCVYAKFWKWQFIYLFLNYLSSNFWVRKMPEQKRARAKETNELYVSIIFSIAEKRTTNFRVINAYRKLNSPPWCLLLCNLYFLAFPLYCLWTNLSGFPLLLRHYGDIWCKWTTMYCSHKFYFIFSCYQSLYYYNIGLITSKSIETYIWKIKFLS